MADEYASMTIDAEAMQGIDDAALANITADGWATAKSELQVRLHGTVSSIRQRELVTEDVFYDGIAALASGKLYQTLRRLVVFEALLLYYEPKEKGAGRGVSTERKTAHYNKRMKRHQARFAQLVEEALANDELDYSDLIDRQTDRPADVTWIA